MAKKKFTKGGGAKGKNANGAAKKADEKFSFDMELLTHKYADYYKGANAETTGLQESETGESNSNFVWYDTREVFYPVYKSKVRYQISKPRPLHPVIAQILEIVKYLQTLKNVDILAKLLEITQLDGEIYQSILGELLVRGLLSDENGELKLSNKGAEVLKNQNEIVRENADAFVLIDGVFGTFLGADKKANNLFCKNKPSENAVELKPKFSARARTEGLFEEFSGGKTLHQVLAEGLRGLDIAENESECEICEINEIIDTRKFFERYFCLFYKNAQDEERVLVIDENYEINRGATALFDKLLSEQNFEECAANANDKNDNKNTALLENREKFAALDGEKIAALTSQKPNLNERELDLNEGSELGVGEHKRYFNHILDFAKTRICIQSPWVRGKIVSLYKTRLEAALKRGVKVCVKYGISDKKPDIDEGARGYFDELKAKFKGLFSTKTDNSHEKYIICDDDFIIGGSFNWLSFGGQKRGKNEPRKESSFIIKNQKTIAKYLKEFGE